LVQQKRKEQSLCSVAFSIRRLFALQSLRLASYVVSRHLLARSTIQEENVAAFSSSSTRVPSFSRNSASSSYVYPACVLPHPNRRQSERAGPRHWPGCNLRQPGDCGRPAFSRWYIAFLKPWKGTRNVFVKP